MVSDSLAYRRRHSASLGTLNRVEAVPIIRCNRKPSLLPNTRRNSESSSTRSSSQTLTRVHAPLNDAFRDSQVRRPDTGQHKRVVDILRSMHARLDECLRMS